MRRLLRGAATAWLAAQVGCAGGASLSFGDHLVPQEQISNGSDTPGSDPSTSPVAEPSFLVTNHIPPESPCVDDSPAPRSLRRLTGDEFNASVRDLLGGGSDVPSADGLFANEPIAYGFSAIQDNLLVRRNNILAVMEAAEAAATYAQGKAATISGCSAPSASCLADFIGRFGRLAFRRPLAPEEVSDVQGLIPSNADIGASVETVVAALLQSPYFLYRSELGGDTAAGGRFALTPYEIATELSYLFWGTTPDATLLKAADDRQLGSPDQLAAQAQRLLADDRAQAPMLNFFLEWLNTSSLLLQVHTEGSTTLDDPTKTAMLAESKAFLRDVIFATPGTFQSLLTANYSFVDQGLGTFYGLSDTLGSSPQKVSWETGERIGGVLGQGAWLTANSAALEASPVLRGRALRMRFLCQVIGSPPSNVPPVGASDAMATTLRERFVAHISDPTCSACHNLMDPLAYPLGNFDGIGRRRPGDQESGKPVDLSGRVNAPMVGEPTDLANGAALAAYLATSSQAQACLSRHWSMYALGRLSWAQDGCTFAKAAAYAASSGSTLKEVLVGITQAPSFSSRVQDT